nr:non-ribosomal peptide synthetase [uncultured bacterium]
MSVLKVGAAYVPLDLGLPMKRLHTILDDSGSRIILADGAGLRLLADTDMFLSPDLIDLEDQSHYMGDADDLGTVIDGSDLAYCIYTSGSTGSPKGVLVHHDGLRNYVEWAARCYMTATIREFALISPISFDLTVTSIFVPLISGRSIRIYPEADGRALPVLRAIRENAVDILKLTPAHLALLAGAELENSRLQTIIVGGEDLKADVAQRSHALFSGRVVIYNEYGPTETVVGCLMHRFDPSMDVTGSVSVGRPIDNTRVYLLGEDMNRVPVGTVGHLHIAGSGVALGYQGKPDLTAAAFRPDPWTPGARMYASGDFARINECGDVVYVGRVDDQVKINGHRVELGEIEHRLLQHPGVTACVVESVNRRSEWWETNQLVYCSRCGLASNVPNTTYDAGNVCSHCRAFDGYREFIEGYFRSMDDLRRLIDDIRQGNTSTTDCLFLLSGGKDSTYALCKTIELGARVLAVTFDPGYLSGTAKENIERTVRRLGVEHRYLTTPAIKEILGDSLRRHSNVCNGCFKTLYTLSMNLALQLGVPYIFTGLSRGQLVDTRLTNLAHASASDDQAIERSIVEARRMYHRIDDAVSRLLDVRCFLADDVFDKVRFVDFYRYSDVSAEEIHAYLADIGWKSPADTGRSTNCLLNATGIYVHNLERGYHNYSLPYSWDVRLGHKTRRHAIHELNDLEEIDIADVRRRLDEIGYSTEPRGPNADPALVGYYVAPAESPSEQLREFLAQDLPQHMVPSCFVHLDRLPLTPNGKVNRRALPRPDVVRRRSRAGYVEPTDETQRTMVKLWSEVLRVRDIGVEDDFFEIGGSSLAAALILFEITRAFDTIISISQFTQMPTISMLARYVDGIAARRG